MRTLTPYESIFQARQQLQIWNKVLIPLREPLSSTEGNAFKELFFCLTWWNAEFVVVDSELDVHGRYFNWSYLYSSRLLSSRYIILSSSEWKRCECYETQIHCQSWIDLWALRHFGEALRRNYEGDTRNRQGLSSHVTTNISSEHVDEACHGEMTEPFWKSEDRLYGFC